MTFRLKSFSFLPRSQPGWSTETFIFSDRFTIFRGRNGAGKTQVMRGIIYSLGASIQFPPDLVDRCSAVQLTATLDGNDIIFTRNLGDEERISISEIGKEVEVFDNEEKFSQRVLSLVGLSIATLTAKRGYESPPFTSIFLPFTFCDQDSGWNYYYTPPANRNFISDQEEEMFRLAWRLPAKRPFKERTEFEAAKKGFDSTSKRMEIIRNALDGEKRALKALSHEPKDALEKRKGTLKKEIDEMKSGVKPLVDSTSAIDQLIAQETSIKDELSSELNSMQRKLTTMDQISEQFDAEAEILSANSSAQDFFRKICTRDGCSLFSNASESFGRRLLYLKDQIKDIRTSGSILVREIDALKERTAAIDDRISDLKSKKIQITQMAGLDGVQAKITFLIKEISDVEYALVKQDSLNGLQSEFNSLLESKVRYEELVKEHRPHGKKTSTLVMEARSDFLELLIKWLGILKTPGANQGVEVDESFSIIFKDEKFTPSSSHSGSTRVRIVLAAKAAIFEGALDRGVAFPNFLLFDTPRQQELELPDLSDYLKKLHELSSLHSCQFVFAAKDQLLNIAGSVDKEIFPTFECNDEVFYFGPNKKPVH